MPDARDQDEPTDEFEAALRAGLRACAATRSLADGTLTRLHGGVSNHAWRLDAPGGPWFARLGAIDAAELGVDRTSECRLLAAVGFAGLAPGLLACEPGTGLLVTRFVEGRAWQAGDVASVANLRRVAELLRRLHELPVPEGVATVSWLRQAQRLAAGLAVLPGDAELHRQAAAVLADLAGRGFLPALCHHDLHHLNVLDDGARLWLVDWEYGGRGDPLVDVAGFLAMHDLGPLATDTFLAAYGRLSPADRERLDAARWAFDYVQWLWYRHRDPGGAGEAGARAQGLARRLLHCDNRPIERDHG